MCQQHSDEAVTVAGTSKKRSHSEFIQAVDGSAKEAHNDALAEQQDPATRLGEKRAKHDQTPCWRCRILKKKVTSPFQFLESSADLFGEV